jgi:hypothetical protein
MVSLQDKNGMRGLLQLSDLPSSLFLSHSRAQDTLELHTRQPCWARCAGACLWVQPLGRLQVGRSQSRRATYKCEAPPEVWLKHPPSECKAPSSNLLPPKKTQKSNMLELFNRTNVIRFRITRKSLVALGFIRILFCLKKTRQAHSPIYY